MKDTETQHRSELPCCVSVPGKEQAKRGTASAAPRKLNVGQVGVGHFGGYRRDRMRETGLFNLLAAYDINPKALAACEKQDGAKPVGSFGDLLEFPGLDAVVISTGAKFHAEQALAAMARGLHVFVEKPLCSTPGEMRALLDAQKKSGVVVGIGHNDHRHDALSSTIKRMVDGGELGSIAAFEKTTAHNGGLQIKPGEWRGDPDKNPGGMLFQCGVHSIHELMHYFGPIRRVSCRMRYDVHTTKTADVAICHLEFASGLMGSLNAYHVTPYRHTFSLFGTKRNLYVENLCFDEGNQVHVQTTKLDGKKEPKEPLKIEGETDKCGNLRSFHEAVTVGGTPYPSLADGAMAVAVVFAAEESARLGRVVDVPPIGG